MHACLPPNPDLFRQLANSTIYKSEILSSLTAGPFPNRAKLHFPPFFLVWFWLVKESGNHIAISRLIPMRNPWSLDQSALPPRSYQTTRMLQETRFIMNMPAGHGYAPDVPTWEASHPTPSFLSYVPNYPYTSCRVTSEEEKWLSWTRILNCLRVSACGTCRFHFLVLMKLARAPCLLSLSWVEEASLRPFRPPFDYHYQGPASSQRRTES